MTTRDDTDDVMMMMISCRRENSLGNAALRKAIVKMPLLVATLGFGWFLYHYAYVAYPLLHEHVFSKCFAKA